MKKIILLGLVLVFFGIVLSSFEYNVTTGIGNCTGSNGSLGTCGHVGCHFTSGISDLNLSIIVTKNSNGQVVTSYSPDSFYTITFRGTHGAGGSPAAYGLQFTTGSSNDGHFTPSGSTLISVSMPPYEFYEHKQPIAPVNNSCNAVLYWRAPAKGAGPITFYCTMLAANGDKTINGDMEKNTVLTLAEVTTSVNNIETIVDATVYPNPTNSDVNLKLDVKESGEYGFSIYDLSGKRLQQGIVNIQNNTITQQISTSALAPGMYILQLEKGSNYKMLSFIKE